MTVGVGTTDEDTVFLNDTETGGRLAGAGQGTGPAVGAESSNEGGTLGCDSGAASEDIEGDAFTEEDFTDGAADGGAMCDGINGVSFFDMPFDSIWRFRFRYRIDGEGESAYVQPNCENTSSTKGTPATTPYLDISVYHDRSR